MSSENQNESKNNNNNLIKILYHQIREGCPRKICYNIYCHNNFICINSKN